MTHRDGASPSKAKGSDPSIYDGVRDIAEYAISDCRRLESITVPDSIEIIGRSAFSGCRRPANVSLPGRLQNKPIGSAFVSCSPELAISYRNGGETRAPADDVSDFTEGSVFQCKIPQQ